MSQAKDGAEDVGDRLDSLFSRHVVESSMRCAQPCTEGQGLADRKMRKVDIHFCVVGDFPSEAFVHDVCGDAIVVDICRERITVETNLPRY
jgi:hypothetical protein